MSPPVTTANPSTTDLYHAILEQATDHILVADPQGSLLDANAKATYLLGYSHAELVKLHLNDLFPPVEQVAQPLQLGELDRRNFIRAQRTLMRKDGSLVTVEVRGQQISDGRLVVILRDLTEIETIETILRDNEEWLRLTHEAAELGTWRLDLATRTVYLDNRACRHYGVTTPKIALDQLLSAIHPDDQHHLQDKVARMLDPTQPNRETIEHRITHPNGSHHWLSVQTRLFFDGQEGALHPALLVGVTREITEQKELEAKLYHHNQQLALLGELSDLLAQSTPDYQTVAKLAAQKIASAFNGGCLICLLSHDGQWLESTALSDPNPAINHLLALILAKLPIPAAQLNFTKWLLRNGKSLFLPTIDDRHVPPESTPEIRKVVDLLKSGMIVPLQVRNQEIGIIYLWRTTVEAGQFQEQDLRFLQQIAERTALAISNGYLYRNLETELAQRRQAEQALRESEQRYRTLINALPVAVYTTDVDGYVTLYNEAAAKLWGRHPKLGTDRWCGTWQFTAEDGVPIPHEQCSMAVALREKRLNTGEEGLITRPDQSRVHIATYPTLLYDAQGEISGGLNVLVDISERKQAEVARQEMAANMAMAQQIAHFGSWEVILDEDLNIIDPHFWSDECYRILDYAPGTEATTERYFNRIHPEDLGGLQMAILQDLHAGRSGTYNFRIQLPDGTTRYIHQQKRIIFDEQSKRPVKVVGSIHDVTERKLMEEALQLEQKRLAKLADAVPGLLFIFRRSPTGAMAVPYCSPGIRNLLGLTPEDLKLDATPIFDRMYPDDVIQTLAAIEHNSQALTTNYLEFRIRHPQKGENWVAIHASPERDDEGGTLWYGFATDITERKRAQEQIHYQANLLANVNDAVIAIDLQSRVTSWNQGAVRLYGWHADEVMGQPLSQILKTDYLVDSRQAVFQHVIQDKVWRGEVTQQRKDGTRFYAMSSVALVYDTNGNSIGFVGVNRDISDRKQVEERLQIALDAARMGVWEWDVQKAQLFLSPESYRILGISTSFQSMIEFKAIVHPEDRERSGESFIRFLTEQTVYTDEIRITHPDGSIRWIATLGKATYNEQQQPVRVVGTIQDITERKKAETERAQLEEQLHQSQKMETIGRLAGGVAHDFNNLLTVIQGYSDVLLGQLGPQNPIYTKLEQINHAGKRAADLTGQLLAFSRRQMLTPTNVDLNQVITTLQRMLERLIGEDILLVTELDPALWTVIVDSSRIEQVIMNLVVNARDAMPTGGSLTIQTDNLLLTPDVEPALREGPHGRCVRLRISDTGHGMEESIRSRIFEPFFTTKEQGKGTGLGLSTAYGIIKQSGGEITVTSTLNVGSTFTVYLPAVHTQLTPEDSIEMEVLPMRGSETILLVEDEEMVRDLIQFSLEDAGFTVVAARSGMEALTVAENYPGRIHMVVTDVVMPQMSGRELADHLKQRYPQTKVLFTSGYTDDAVVRHGLLTAEVAFLQKPFSPEALVSRVRTILDE